eukprot:UN12367
MERLAEEQKKFGNFQATERRRRLMKRQMQENLTKTCHDLVQQLRQLSGKTLKDDEDLDMYNKLKDVNPHSDVFRIFSFGETYNAFDRDGSGKWHSLNIEKLGNSCHLPGKDDGTSRSM